jgi:hypothetical protein
MDKLSGLCKGKAEADAIMWASEKSENVCPHPGDCASGIWDFLPSLGPGEEVSQRPRLQSSFIFHDALEFGRIFTPYLFVRVDGQNRDMNHLPFADAGEGLNAA